MGKQEKSFIDNMEGPSLPHWLGQIMKAEKPGYALVVSSSDHRVALRTAKALRVMAKSTPSEGVVLLADNTNHGRGEPTLPFDELIALATNKTMIQAKTGDYLEVVSTPIAIIIATQEPKHYVGHRFLHLTY